MGKGQPKDVPSITTLLKGDILKRVEGEKMANVACSFGINSSRIGTIIKNKDKNTEHKFLSECNLFINNVCIED